MFDVGEGVVGTTVDGGRQEKDRERGASVEWSLEGPRFRSPAKRQEQIKLENRCRVILLEREEEPQEHLRHRT